jgi:hypothetical protein
LVEPPPPVPLCDTPEELPLQPYSAKIAMNVSVVLMEAANYVVRASLRARAAGLCDALLIFAIQY